MTLTGWSKCEECGHQVKADLAGGQGISYKSGCSECGGKKTSAMIGLDQPSWWDEAAFQRQATKRLTP